MIRCELTNGHFSKDPKGLKLIVTRDNQEPDGSPHDFKLLHISNRLYRGDNDDEKFHLAETLKETVFDPFINMSGAEQILKYKEYSSKVIAKDWDWWINCNYIEWDYIKKREIIIGMGNCYSLGAYDMGSVNYIYMSKHGKPIKKNPFPFFDTPEDVFKFIITESKITA